MTVGKELMSLMISFQMIPVVSQSEVTDSIKSLFCLIGVSNNQTSALQCLNLLYQRHRLFGISHVYIQKMSRWVRCSYGKRAGFVDAKISILSDSNKHLPIFLIIFKEKWSQNSFTRLVKAPFLHKKGCNSYFFRTFAIDSRSHELLALMDVFRYRLFVNDSPRRAEEGNQ